MLTNALIILFFVIGLPFGIWMMWMALTFDNQTEMWRDK
jgi:hypothetical protein